ncbi:hypothetical protein MBLNU230_g2035t1 [Neophaeotheca triangularis]
MRQTPSRNVWLVCLLLLVAGLFDFTSAARPPRQRLAEQNPYILPPGLVGEAERPSRHLADHQFTLRHIYHHGSHKYPNLHRYIDVPADAKLQVSDDYGATYEPAPETLQAKARSMNIQRMVDRTPETIDKLLGTARARGETLSLPPTAWTTDEIAGPNITDKETILSMARMANNAYTLTEGTGEWQEVGGGFNYTEDFGWEADGLRGHIFADKTNGTVVVGLKGTSMAVFDGAETTGNDKTNDNLFGSCCCGQGGQYQWKQVCDCMTSTYTCNSTCLRRELEEKSHYYTAVRDLYHNVTERYPESEVWMSGHSLGGVVSSLLGLTYGLPVLTFEAFPDAMAASRLGLPVPPGYHLGSHQARPKTGIYHFGHTADPIFMGTCNSAFSFCTIGGYAFQGLCHTGQTCQYDTVGDLGWRVSLGTHRITSVIKDVISKYDTVPACEEDIECQDCPLWKFYESNSSSTTTSLTSSSTASTTTVTRTETCHTPGWWGCLDPSTTTAPITTTTSSSSTSTCKTPGWFGCKDPTTTTVATTITTPTSTVAEPSSLTSSSSTSCKTPGWFGCKDKSTTAVLTPPARMAQATAAVTGNGGDAFVKGDLR